MACPISNRVQYRCGLVGNSGSAPVLAARFMLARIVYAGELIKQTLCLGWVGGHPGWSIIVAFPRNMVQVCFYQRFGPRIYGPQLPILISPGNAAARFHASGFTPQKSTCRSLSVHVSLRSTMGIRLKQKQHVHDTTRLLDPIIECRSSVHSSMVVLCVSLCIRAVRFPICVNSAGI